MAGVKNVQRACRSAGVVAAVLLTVPACAHIDVAPRALAPDPSIPSCAGIAVAVDGRALAGTGDGGYAHPQATCVRTDEPMTALTAFTTAELTPTRASQDGSAVCRVQGDPFDGLAIARPGGGVYFETCDSAPPDFARWVVWSRDSGEAAWSDATQDLAALELSPGAAVAVVFTYRGEPSTPGF